MWFFVVFCDFYGFTFAMLPFVDSVCTNHDISKQSVCSENSHLLFFGERFQVSNKRSMEPLRI